MEDHSEEGDRGVPYTGLSLLVAPIGKVIVKN